MTFIIIESRQVYETATEAQVTVARAALQAAGLEYADEYDGDPDCPDARKNGYVLFADPRPKARP